MMGVTPEMVAKHCGEGDGFPGMSARPASNSLSQVPGDVQKSLNAQLGISDEVFSKFNSGHQVESNIYDVAKAVLRERPY